MFMSERIEVVGSAWHQKDVEKQLLLKNNAYLYGTKREVFAGARASPTDETLTYNNKGMNCFSKLFCVALLCVVAIQPASAQTNAGRDVYLLATPRGSAGDSLQLFFSYDGQQWDILSGAWHQSQIGSKSTVVDASASGGRIVVPRGQRNATVLQVKEPVLKALQKIEAARHFALGADISGTTQMESRGTRFYNSKGEIRENTALMKELGLNAVRLRVWVNPRGGWSGAQDVLEMAKRAKYYNMDLMIDFHYSDWWADPGKQNIPAEWKDYDYPQMKEALAKHTRDVLQLLKDNRINVKWVQVGNETRTGFLWPMGHTGKNMEQYAGLTDAGYEAVKSVYPNAQVIVHIDRGCDQKVYDYIFDGLKKYGARWDMIGLSVYPYWDIDSKVTKSWQETVAGFTANIRHLVKKYGTPTMVVETGVVAKKAVEEKPIMDAIMNAARYECDGDCYGVFYWAPELEGGYALGAFDNNRPTVIMDTFTEASKN